MNVDDHQPHILVIDDSPDILDLKDDILESEGFRVTTMLRKDVGLPDIIAAEPGLLLMDYVPFKASSLMHDIATDPRTRRIPILICTGAIHAVEAIRPELDARGVRVIYKPFDIYELILTVREMLGPLSR